MLAEDATRHEVEALIARREMTERNRAALNGRPGRFYDYTRGCYMFRLADGTEERAARQ